MSKSRMMETDRQAVPRRFDGPAGGGVEVLFVAGEHSGDQHAARLARQIAAAHPAWRMAALGGPCLQRAGVQLLHDLTRHSVVGLVEVLRHYGTFRRLFAALLDWVAVHRPRVVVLVDYPGFNLRFAEALRRRGLSRKGGGDVAVYQYISPQIWAWKAGRRFRMARCLDELGVIFPFETGCYADTGLPVHFTGHPFTEPGYVNPVRYDADGPLLLLPGSRRQPVRRIFPVMAAAVRAYRAGGGSRPCVCLYPEGGIRSLLEAELRRQRCGDGWIALRPVEDGAAASAVLTSSGTMSLNCALAGIPGAIVYRAHPITAWLGRRLVQVPWLGIANLVLGEPLYPEFLQRDARPEVLATLLHGLPGDAAQRARFAAGAVALRGRLSAPAAAVVDRLARLLGGA